MMQRRLYYYADVTYIYTVYLWTIIDVTDRPTSTTL